MKIYKNPKYYEIGFSFVDVKKQIRVFENFIKKYSSIDVKRVLDIACGTSSQLIELVKKGYACIGLDKSREMLQYLREKARRQGVKVKTINADMKDFKCKVDLAFILLGSINYLKNEKEIDKHFRCLAKCLNIVASI